jgi:hypothetical protein
VLRKNEKFREKIVSKKSSVRIRNKESLLPFPAWNRKGFSSSCPPHPHHTHTHTHKKPHQVSPVQMQYSFSKFFSL